jgi:hypothetical protein
LPVWRDIYELRNSLFSQTTARPSSLFHIDWYTEHELPPSDPNFEELVKKKGQGAAVIEALEMEYRVEHLLSLPNVIHEGSSGSIIQMKNEY